MAFERLRGSAGGFGNIARAFSHRNYRVYVSGNSISLTGLWLQRVAVGWLGFDRFDFFGLEPRELLRGGERF